MACAVSGALDKSVTGGAVPLSCDGVVRGAVSGSFECKSSARVNGSVDCCVDGGVGFSGLILENPAVLDTEIECMW